MKTSFKSEDNLHQSGFEIFVYLICFVNISCTSRLAEKNIMTSLWILISLLQELESRQPLRNAFVIKSKSNSLCSGRHFLPFLSSFLEFIIASNYVFALLHLYISSSSSYFASPLKKVLIVKRSMYTDFGLAQRIFLNLKAWRIMLLRFYIRVRQIF